MSIWKTKRTIQEIEEQNKDTMAEHLGIKIIEVGDDFIRATMPVDHRTKQPRGLLHGGASATLAESIGSLGTRMSMDPGSQCVGLEINANHIRSITDGTITGIARPIHMGRSTHIWDIKIHDKENNIVCVARLTMMVIEKENNKEEN